MSKRLFASILCAVLLLALIPSSLIPAAVAAETLKYSFPFDDEAAQGEYFASNGDTPAAEIEWVSSPGIGHGDDTALRVTHIEGKPYTSNINAVRLTLPEPLPAGGVYRIVAWVYAPSDENPGKGTLTGPGFVLNDGYPDEQGVTKFPPAFGTLPLDEWKQIDVTLPLQVTPLRLLDFRIVINDADKHPDVWYWDNIEIYQVGELEEVEEVKEWDPATEPLTRNRQGSYEGFDFEFWSEQPDQGSMMLTGGGTYTCEWDGLNLLFRTGKRLDRTKTYAEYGEITMEYGAEHTLLRGDVSYLTVYGWTENPMIEYYILENRGTYKPGGTDLRGTYQMDGGTYELYVDLRVNKPSIDGNKTFEQYFAIRTDVRTSGTISISEHFKEWEKLGLDMSGTMYDVMLCIEGYNGVGNANIYSHRLTLGEDTYGFVADAPATATAAPTEEPTETEAPAAIEEPESTPAPEPTPAPTETPGDSSGLPGWLIAVIVVAAVLLIGGCIVVFTRKNKKT